LGNGYIPEAGVRRSCFGGGFLFGGRAAFGLEGEKALTVGVDVCEQEHGEAAQLIVGGDGAGLHIVYHSH